MNPIISPWIIYLIGLLDSLKVLSLFTIVFGILFAFVAIIEESKWLKPLVITIIIAVLIFILIPSKSAMISMLTVSFITPDNISLVQGNIAEFIRNIIVEVNKQ